MSKQILNTFPDIEYPLTLAKINNQYASLEENIPPGGKIELLDIRNTEGRRTYERTLVFLLDYIAKKNGVTIKIEHSYGDALYGRFLKGSIDIKKAKKNINDLIKANVKIERLMLSKLEALHLLKKREDDYNILKYLSRTYIPVYKFQNFKAYFAGPLLPRTGLMKIFDLIKIKNGFLIILPSQDDPNTLGKIEHREQLFKTYRESKREVEILNVWDIAHLNEYVVSGKISEIVKLAEAIHTEKFTNICKEITSKRERLSIILIAGPSSSGKTTFSKRLGVHLRLHGFSPIYISLDDYFLEREKTPIYKDGIPFFETIEAIDIKLFQKHIKQILKGKEVKALTFNFKKRRKEWRGRKLKLTPNSIIIVEGIHAFNPDLLSNIDINKHLIYVSALTQLNINRVNRIPTRDVRLLRRIFRDTRFRGYNANETLKRWESVKEGEDRFIFPYQERADIMFNSSLVYELAVLKGFLETPLRCVETSSPYYCEALRLLNFLDHLLNIREEEIPQTSILREFIGGSTFYY